MANNIGTDLVLPSTGELVSLQSPPQVARALETLRELKYQIREVEAELTNALVEHSRELGSRTITLDDGHRAIVKSGLETVYDSEAIMEGLREAGMPEQRIAEIVRETVMYKVNAVEAKRAAAANPDYALVIESNSHVEQRRPSVELR